MSVKKTAIKSTQTNDLFNNPAVASALQNMSPEQLEKYQQIGEKMYGDINFAKNEVLSNIDPPTEEKLSYIIAGLKSGILPSDMNEDEIMLMIEYYGENWFENFGISKSDIGDMAKKIFNDNEKYKKCGRNDRCPCGSGKKYKVCHFSKVMTTPKFVQTKTMNIFQ